MKGIEVYNRPLECTIACKGVIWQVYAYVMKRANINPETYFEPVQCVDFVFQAFCGAMIVRRLQDPFRTLDHKVVLLLEGMT